MGATCTDCGKTFEDGTRHSAETRLDLHQKAKGHGSYDAPAPWAKTGPDLDEAGADTDAPNQVAPATAGGDGSHLAGDADADGDDPAPTLPGSVELRMDPAPSRVDVPPADDVDGADDQDGAPSEAEVEAARERQRRRAAELGPEPFIKPIIRSTNRIVNSRLERWDVDPISDDDTDALVQAWSTALAPYWIDVIEYLPIGFAIVLTGTVYGPPIYEAWERKEAGQTPKDDAPGDDAGEAATRRPAAEAQPGKAEGGDVDPKELAERVKRDLRSGLG